MIVIPIGGIGSRFLLSGYRESKYLLKLDDEPVLYWVLKSFAKYTAEKILIVLGPHNVQDREVIAQVLNRLNFLNFEIVVLKQKTKGQASTVYHGLQMIRESNNFDSESLLIFNADTIRPNFHCSEYGGLNNWVETFNASGNHWSFIKPVDSKSRKVSQIEEKKRISNFCCTGAYYFSNCAYFMDLYCTLRDVLKFAQNHQEEYVSSTIKLAIERGDNVLFDHVPSQLVLVAGTPDEYQKLRLQSIPSLFSS